MVYLASTSGASPERWGKERIVMNKTRTKSKCAPAPKKSKPVAIRVVAQENVPIPAPNVEAEELREIEIALADAEYEAELDELYPPESNEDLILQVEDMLEELIHTASKSQSSTVSHLAFVLTTLFPRLEKVSNQSCIFLFAGYNRRWFQFSVLPETFLVICHH